MFMLVTVEVVLFFGSALSVQNQFMLKGRQQGTESHFLELVIACEAWLG